MVRHSAKVFRLNLLDVIFQEPVSYVICHKRSYGELYDEIAGVLNRAAKRMLNQVPVRIMESW